MKFIRNPFNICHMNIASEEYMMTTYTEPIFYLYINRPSVIVGRNQNTYRELNQDFVEKNLIDVVRRGSGGGAVYHDLGNLNFGFIFENTGKNFDEIFREFTFPILAALQDMGVKAEFSGRNDMTIEGAKFSGNAQWHRGDKVMVHGTLLFDSDLTVLSKVLRPSPLKFVDKGVDSVRSRVTNIKPHLPEGSQIDLESFAAAISTKVQELLGSCTEHIYGPEEIEAIEKLCKEKYATKQHNYGSSPAFSLTNRFRFAGGTMEICLNIKDDKIEDVKIYGDFFGKNPDISLIEKELIKKDYTIEAIDEALTLAEAKGLPLSDFVVGLSKELFIKGFFEAV